MKLRLIAAVSAGLALLAVSLTPAAACYYDGGYSYSYGYSSGHGYGYGY